MTHKYILLVEDNAHDEELTMRALKKAPLINPVVVARDGVEALDIVFGRGQAAERSADDLPQLVLLDLKLPKLNGHEVLKAIRANERTKLLPVVMLTSSLEEQDLVQSYGLGANAYVRKPVDFVQFTDAVRQLGMFWLVLNVNAPLHVKG